MPPGKRIFQAMQRDNRSNCVREEVVNDMSSGVSNMLDIFSGDDVRRAKHHMIPRDAINGAGSGIYRHIVRLRKGELMYPFKRLQSALLENEGL